MWFDPTNYLGVPKWGVCSADEPGAPGELCDIDRGIIRGRSNDSVGLAFNPVTGEYRDGSGRFVEIPPGFTYNVRDEQWYDQFGHKIEWSDPDGMWISTASPNPSQGYGGEVIPFSNIPNPVAPALQKYANADAAGYFLVDKVWSLSQKYNVEMGGGIWQRPEDGTCYTRDILVGGPTGIDPGFVDEIRYEGKAAPGDKLVGWYHVHPEGHQNIGGEAFSAGDEGVSKGLGVPGYLGTPNGVFKVVYPNGTAKTVTLLPPTPADRVLEERLLDVLRRR